MVHKPGVTHYGVELSVPADAARFQVRLVGATPGTPRDACRDADQKTIWCDEFDRLRASMGDTGKEIVVERAIEAGKMLMHSAEMPIEAGSKASQERCPVSNRRSV